MQRMTRQRQAILAAFDEAGRPLSPREIHEVARAAVPDINLATVYRNLKGLVESGALSVVEIPGQPARYELPGLDHHHHFLCRQCGRLFDLPGCPGTFRGLAPRGFKVDGHDLTLTGFCSACA